MNIYIRERSPGTWRVRLRVAGELDQWRTVKGDRRAAERFADEWGRLVTLQGAMLSPAMTVGRLAQHLLDTNTHFRANTRRQYETLLRQWILPPRAATPEARKDWGTKLPYNYQFGAIPLGKVRASDGENFKVWLLDRLSAAGSKNPSQTAYQAFRFARWVMAEAARLQIIERSPLAALRVPRIIRRERSVPDNADMARLAEIQTDDAAGTFIRLLIHTGARRSELLALTWRDVQLDAGVILIRRQLIQLADGELTTDTPKSKAGLRTVSIADAMITELRAVRAAAALRALAAGRAISDQPVLPAPSGEGFWWPDYATKRIGRLMAKHGLTRGTVHGLRHAHATALLRSRLNPKLVQQRLGHADMATTLGIYAHVVVGDDLAAADAIVDALRSGKRA